MQPGTDAVPSDSYSTHPAVPGQLSLKLVQNDGDQEQSEEPHEPRKRNNESSGNRSFHRDPSSTSALFASLLTEALAEAILASLELQVERWHAPGEVRDCG
jgi:hypothetical protein